MVLDPAHRPITVRTWSQAASLGHSSAHGGGKRPLGRWAPGYGGKPQRRERKPALPAEPGAWGEWGAPRKVRGLRGSALFQCVSQGASAFTGSEQPDPRLQLGFVGVFSLCCPEFWACDGSHQRGAGTEPAERHLLPKAAALLKYLTRKYNFT